MSQYRVQRHRKASLRRSRNWLPFVVLPFALFFFEAWLKTETIVAGYEANDLEKEIQEVRDRINALESRVANLERMERIDVQAHDLGLREPAPGDTEVLEIPIEERMAPMEPEPEYERSPPALPPFSFDLARLLRPSGAE